MLNVPNLDDQRFDEIMAASIEKIPCLYPEWTDYNAHDPGITLLELFAWYKQMQQYHLNQIPERNQEAFFKLLGIRRRQQQPFSLMMRIVDTEQRTLTAGTPIISEAGVPFEISDGVAGADVKVKAIYSDREDGVYDVTDMFGNSQAPFYPFGRSLSGPHHELYIGLSHCPEADGIINLWIEVADSLPVKRNPFGPDSDAPRNIKIEAVGPQGERVEIETLQDDTRAFSRSGRLALRAKAPLVKGDGGMGLPDLFWIKLYLIDPGCEEMPALIHIISGYVGARQTCTLCKSHDYTLTGIGKRTFCLYDYLALHGHVDVYVRDKDGWYRVGCDADTADIKGVNCLCVSTEIPDCIAMDGGPNLRIICSSPRLLHGMRYSSTGLPAQRMTLVKEEGEPLCSEVSVMCISGEQTDRVRMRDWGYIDSLDKAGPGEALFTIDRDTGEMCFGDNICGAVLPKGKDAVVITGLAYTQSVEGGITPGTMLYLGDEPAGAEDAPVGEALSVVSGRALETMGEMRLRLRKILEAPAKAVTAEDCAAIAMNTPGIRIAHARAVPLMNPNGRGELNARAHVSVVVLPYNTQRFPRPDKRFLDAVQAQLDRHRTICTQMHAIGPEYIGITVWAEIISGADEDRVKQSVRQALEGYFAMDVPGGRLGITVLESELSSVVGSCREVLGLVRLEARPASAKCSKTAQGELLVPPYAIAYLSALELHITHV